MARNRNQIFRSEDGCLLGNSAPHLGEGEAMLRGVEAIDATGLLHGLKPHTAHGRLLERIVDNRAEFAVVHAALDGHDKGG